MDVDQIKETLVDEITKNIRPYHYNVTKTELMIRCPYCGDSNKNSTHTHLYIGLSYKNSIPYYCQRCATSDYVDSSFLKDIGINDTNLMVYVDKIKKEYKKQKKTRKLNDNEILNKIVNSNEKSKQELILPKFKNSKRNLSKYDYFMNRFSFDKEIITPDYLIENYKVIFSFKDFILDNNIEDLYVGDYMLENLVKNYIGFLSSDQSYIIFRNILPDVPKNQRYYMYNIFDDKTGKRFYTTKSHIDILTDKINLVMSEGPFDIIGIREYFYKEKDDNTIFVSVNGKGYNLIVNYFARLGFINMDIYIYSDKDVDLSMYKNFKKNNSVFLNNKIRVYYNKINKDYGVKRDLIQLKSNII